MSIGTPRLTVVRNVKYRKPYQPHFDHWKDLRDAIITYHLEGNTDKKYFDDFLSTVIKEEKRESYRPVIAQYKKFLGKKKCATFKNDRIIWTHNDLEVSINPELCISINGEKHLIKLYFKDTKLIKLQADVILYLMKHALPTISDLDYYAILDVQSNKLIKSANPNDSLKPLLLGEAESFIRIYKELPDKD